MRIKAIFIGLILGLFCVNSSTGQTTENKEPVDYVDPIIGTSNARWMMFPGASMPFGMVKLSPDNQRRGWKAGYEYNIDNIAGFSHIHSWTMAGLLMMPTTGPLLVKPGSRDNPDKGYRSRFSHDNEEASPGYYSVTLDDYDIKTELTSTTRAGFHKYTFPESDSARILLDLQFPSEYSYEISAAQITKVSDTEIQGYSVQQSLRKANYNEYTLHFVIRFSKPFESLNGWTRDGVQRNVEKIFSGWGHTDFGGFVEFNTSEGEVIKVQTGISLVSVDQARKNLEEEMVKPFDWDFAAVQKNASQTWNDLLSTIEVEGGSKENKTKFYTNLYRAYVGRTTWSDVDGKYVDMCEETVQLDDPLAPVYGGDAFWNTFWNLNQLWTLATPDIANNWVKSLLEIYDRGGWLPKGPTGIEYSSIMVASHEIPLMVSAYQKGIRNYDVDKAYKAMKHNQMVPGKPHECGGLVGNRHLKSYMELGYVADEVGPVSNTTEYAYDDWTVAQMAKALGKQGDYQYFLNRAKNYQNIFDPSIGYVRMKKANGDWVEKDFDPYCCSTFLGSGFVEGNAWQYTFFAPHDVSGLVDLVGKDEFNERLEEGFKKSQKYRFNAEQIDYENNLHAMGLLPVNHGNQPNMQSAYLFNYSGQPWQTQKWARAIMDEYYGLGPEDGWPGDEDQGQMGGWFVMSAMGLFQMEGGASTEPFYELGSPIFEKVTIHLDDKYYEGDTFVIEAKDVSDKNKYIQSAQLNGKPMDKPWFYHKDLVKGGKLTLQMGPEPKKSWGSDPEDAPPSMSSSDAVESEMKPEAGTVPENTVGFEQGHYELFAPTYLGDSEEWIRPNAKVTAQNPISGSYSFRFDANKQKQEWVFASNAFYLDDSFTLSTKVRVDSPTNEEFGLGIAAMQTKDSVAALRLDEKGISFDQQKWDDAKGGQKGFQLQSGSVYTLQLKVTDSDVEVRILDAKGQQVHAKLHGKSDIDPSAIGLYLSTSAGGQSTLYIDDVSVETTSYRMQADEWIRSPQPLALSRLPDVTQDQGNWVGGMTVREIDDEYWMWYRIRDNEQRGGGYGLARSKDGLEWEKYDKNPLFKADDKFESNEKISVLKVDDKFKAWYAVDTGDSWATAYATSEDGIHWNKHGIVVESYAKDADVVYVDGTYYLYAIAPTKNDISVFTSPNGQEWELQNTFAMGAHHHPAAYYVDQDNSFRLYAFGGDKGVSVATSKDGINFGNFKKEWSPSSIGLDDWDQWGVDYGAFPTDEWGHLQDDDNSIVYYQARHAYGNNHGTWKYHGDGVVLTAGKFSDLFVGIPTNIRPNKPYQYKAFPFPARKADGLAVTATDPITLTVDSWDEGSEFPSRGRIQASKKGQVHFAVTGLKSHKDYKLRVGDHTVKGETNQNGETTFTINLSPDTNAIFELMEASF